MENIDIKAILEIIFNYFLEVFKHWYPDVVEGLEDLKDEFAADAE